MRHDSLRRVGRDRLKCLAHRGSLMSQQSPPTIRRGVFRSAEAVLLLTLFSFLATVFIRGNEIQALAQGRRAHAGPTGSLSGTVVGPDGNPVAGARVMAQTSDGRAPRTTTTDASGHFRFHGLRVAPYDLRARANKTWSDWRRDVPVRANEEATVKLRIPPAKAAPVKTPAPEKPRQGPPTKPPQQQDLKPGPDAAP